MAFLLVVSGPNEGDYHPLEKRSITVGRNEDRTIQIVDPQVSRKHLRVQYDDSTGGYRALDDESVNGVFINEKQIADEVPLANGDIIRIGNSELIYSEQDFIDRATALEHYRRQTEHGRDTLAK